MYVQIFAFCSSSISTGRSTLTAPLVSPSSLSGSNPRPLGAFTQVLTERPVAALQILLALGAIELTAGKQDYENKAPGELGR